ncbi:MAG: zinc metallopeptidase [bacterium]|nr:zinc metallopeptidase [bacterium]
MRWQGRRTSANVEDRRGMGGGMARRGAPIGCGGLIVIVLLAWMFGRDPQQLIEVIQDAQVGQGMPAPGSTSGGPGASPRDTLGEFASVVLADTEDTWNQLLGSGYQEPAMVLFSGQVRSACGFNSAAVGPFYCPADSKVYLDLSFFDQLERRFGAPGDFAQAYVIAHEVGHHIQNQMGISDQVQRARQRTSREQGNQLSVKLELQADCLAGVWGHHANRQRNLIEPGDFEEGLRAAAAIGDDSIQRKSNGYVQPESWTHGSSEQRQRWLYRGLETGDPQACDTFQ